MPKEMGVDPLLCRLQGIFAAASIQPDTEFRKEGRSTAPWHFIDICLQDERSDLSARCPGGACVTGED
jgi:hypothetical protein